MKIDKKVVDDLNKTIVLTLEKGDVEPKVKSELKKLASKTSMKGFRKGKTPIGMVKKMYGQQVLVEVINKAVEEEMNKLMEEEKASLLGQPIPSKEHVDINFDVNKIEDYVFTFDIGLAPEIKVGGISSSDSYDIYNPKVSDKAVDDEIANIRRQHGTVEEAEGDIEEKDIIEVAADEASGRGRKKDGWASTFSVLVEGLSEEYKKEVLGKKAGDEFKFDIYELEPGKSEEYVDKYLLNRGPEDADVEIGKKFVGKIGKISRLKEADLDQELFDKLFGEGEVKSEEELRAKLVESTKKYLDDQAEKVMYGELVSSMNESTEVELPEDFLRRWLLLSNEEMTEEKVDEEFEDFKKGLKWTLIKEKIAKDKGIEVTAEEVQKQVQDEIMSYFSRNQGTPEIMQGLYKSLMSNQQEVKKRYDQLLVEKVLAAVAEDVTKVEQDIEQEDFIEKVKELNEKQNAE